MLTAPMPLTDQHLLDRFDCGVAALTTWLQKRALANQMGGGSRTYVITDGTPRVMGYYALASGSISLAAAPGRLKRNMPDPIPMALLGRLAVDLSLQDRGIGTALLKDAVLRTQQAAAILGIRGLMVHAISPQARDWYVANGFTPGPTEPMTLVLSLRT